MKEQKLLKDQLPEGFEPAKQLGTCTIPGGSGPVPAPIHPREEERIARLLGYEILDTENDPTLDQLTEIAASICEVPIVLISLVDRTRQWFKAAYGLPVRETSRDLSFCAYAILEPEKLFIVPDTTKDPRFATNPLVTGEPHIRFYAGIPLVDRDNIALGTFCVIDKKPKQLSDLQLQLLRKLSAVAMGAIEAHRANAKLTRLLQLEKEVYNKLLRSSSELVTVAPTFDEALTFLMNHLDPNLGWLSARIRNMRTSGTTGISYNPALPPDANLPRVWQHIESLPRHIAEAQPHTEFVSCGPDQPDYSYMVIPVSLRGKLFAIIELIFPDHRKAEPRILEVFELMATNLAIIAERELTELELIQQATHDHLTGAANRPVILRTLEQAIRECDPMEPNSALFFFDIDGFKDVNDNFGHETGDRLLQEIARRLDSVSRSSDMLGRLSGDEFVLLLRGIDIDTGLAPLIQRIQHSLENSFMLGELELRMSSSIGCAVLNNPDISANELIRRAEEAMYLVKNGERKGFCIADEEVVHLFHTKRNLDSKVKEAFRNNRFLLHYQPIVDLKTGGITSVESLLRLLDKDGTIVNACDLMKSIERTRLGLHLDEWVLAEAIRIFSPGTPGRMLLREGLRFSINISPAILSTKKYASKSIEQMGNASIPLDSLTLEIIESNLIPASEVVINNLSVFRKNGIRIALDDFGTGYSNLQQLSQLPVDIIKIDKEFLQGITDNNATKNTVLSAIVAIGKNLGYQIVAEGVETEMQAEHLQRLGCQFGQGFLFGKAMPMDQLVQLMKTPPVFPFLISSPLYSGSQSSSR